jgi:hypothetical protein
MKLAIHFAVFWACLVLSPNLAEACDDEVTWSLIAYRQDWSDFVFREQRTRAGADGAKKVEILLLRSQTLKRWKVIQSFENKDDATRSQRWKAAEAELVSGGFAVAPKYSAWSATAPQEWTAPDGEMMLQTRIAEGKMHVVVEKGSNEVAAEAFELPPASPAPTINAIYSNHDGNTVLALFEVNCSPFIVRLSSTSTK